MREANGGDGRGPQESSTLAALDSPLGQTAVKLIGNVCFSFFVLSVLIFTVIAVTYQPPDPWLDSSVAVTRTFEAITNATISTDETLITTAEDLTSNTSGASSPPLDATAAVPAFLPPLPAVPSASSCSGSLPLNCSDPGILAAIVRFNAKVKVFRSIVFLAYETPVSGSKPDECDVAWSFRNRKEKSWRKYRDYRRFRLAPGDNCTYDVLAAGKYRSGTNASRRARPPSSSSAKNTSPTVPYSDSDINDTIPVVGSEEFRKGKYLYYSRGGDHCKGMNHYLWSFLCGLGEAQYLNRTFVMDLKLCLAATYNSNNKDDEGKDFRFYFDFEHLKETASVVEEGEFLRDWSNWERASRGKKKKPISVRKVPTYKITPMQLKKDRSNILWRQFDGPEPENYWYRVCEGRAAKYVRRPWQSIWKSKRLMNIVTAIGASMDWDYDALHVVRGDKAANKELWPHLDADTSPVVLVSKVLKMVKEWRNLYIATNEPFYNYFDKLRSHYKLHLLDDYKELWNNRSEWYNETAVLNGGTPVEFDGYMRVAVDTEVLYRAKTRVETFNNLTADCKDGINTC